MDLKTKVGIKEELLKVLYNSSILLSDCMCYLEVSEP